MFCQEVARAARLVCGRLCQGGEVEEQRRTGRAMLLIIKAKLEAIRSAVATLQDDFLPYTVKPDGSPPLLAGPKEDKSISFGSVSSFGSGHVHPPRLDRARNYWSGVEQPGVSVACSKFVAQAGSHNVG
jgi:hypothetical protein